MAYYRCDDCDKTFTEEEGDDFREKCPDCNEPLMWWDEDED